MKNKIETNNEQNQMNSIENNVAAPAVETEIKTKKTAKAKAKAGLNKECTKVLNVIVKNENITATEIRKRLRWGFTPTRALSFLRTSKFVSVSKEKGYSVSAKGTAALAAAPAIKTKRAKKTAKPVVAVEAPEAPAAVEAPAAMEPVLA